ncbi:MAG: two-component regulator propeller domain-containing protein [bacterium]|nr:two-component regulator propeller domain-containing protein [bacterium]
MSVRAQQFFFKNYSVESGLPFIQVSCMYQDSNGYLWGGGYGGLSRFDGKQFLNFNRKNGLIDHNVNAICTDAQGSVFIGTNKGLSVLTENKFLNFNKFKDYPDPTISSFCKGYHHSIYIGTARGLYMYKDKQVNAVKKLEGYRINCLFNPDTNVIFVGTDKGLVLFGHKTFKLVNKNAGLASDNVTCLARFKHFLVIGTTKGLTLYDLKTQRSTNYFIENGLIDENISSLANQNNDYLWVGSASGLLRFDGNQFSYFNIGFDINSNQVRCILKDREDNIWLGTHSGLFRYRDNAFSTFDKVMGLGNSLIFQIFRDKNQDLWVCSQNNGVYRQNQNYFKRFGSAEGLTGNTSHAGIEDSEGRLIFGSDEKILIFENEHFVELPMPTSYRGPCEVIFEDSKKTIWIGGTNCLVALTWKDGMPQTKYYKIPSVSEFVVYGFCEDDHHTLYIGTFKGGLYTLKNDSLLNLSSELKLNEETFFTLKYFKTHVFAASLNGLLVFNTQTNELKKISDVDGLNSELIYSIEITRDQKSMWIGTNQGINKLNLEKYLETGKIDILAFGKQEGFAGVECNNNGIWEDGDGTLWFGTVSGLVKHQPFNFKKNRTENRTLIQNIKLLNEDTLLRDSVTLPSDFNVISFYYRGICLTNPERVLYQRKLVGLDKEWSTPNTEDFIKYTNLSPGKYVFKIRSCNNEGVWNEVETSFSFNIKPPFYLTWWFILALFLFVFGTIYALFTLRVYAIKKRQQVEFERKVEMSKMELKALRSQMNPHFIFNSLNAIQHYILHSKSDEAIKYLNKFARLVRLILNSSEKPTVTVGDDLEALKLYLELEQMRFEDKFDYEIIVDSSVDADYDIMPPLVMQPYVENAILHGLNPRPEKGILTIRLHSENNFLICTITDNGIGREKSAEIRKTMPVKNHKSLGMKITEDRLKILNEINNSQLSVTITDLKDVHNNSLGTKVQLFIPLIG